MSRGSTGKNGREERFLFPSLQEGRQRDRLNTGPGAGPACALHTQTPSPAAPEGKQGRSGCRQSRPRAAGVPGESGLRCPPRLWRLAGGMHTPELGPQALPGKTQGVLPQKGPQAPQGPGHFAALSQGEQSPRAAEAPPPPQPTPAHPTPPQPHFPSATPPLPPALSTPARWGFCKSWLELGLTRFRSRGPEPQAPPL